VSIETHRVLIVLAAVLSVAAVQVPAGTAAGAFPTETIGRLVVNGRFVCTAFLIRSEETASSIESEQTIYRNWLVTAGHCVEQSLFDTQPVFLLASRGGAGRDNAHPVVPAGFSGRRPSGYDIAVLVFWTAHPIPTLEPAFSYPLRDGEWLVSAGFPRGVLSYAVGGYLGTNAHQLLLVDAPLSQGSSGSPVLLLGTRRVVGVIVEGTLKESLSPAGACIVAHCVTDRPSLAAPIGWVLRVMRW
jgi:hypothetical protein